MLKLNKTNESGRSMVEMLGVLAIIGVLSVMGIAGYTQAMKSHRANEIVNATSMLYMMGISANAGAGATEDLTYSSAFGQNPPDGAGTLTYKANGTIELTIADEAIRSRVEGILGSKATSTEGSNTLSIDMSHGSGSSSSSQGGNSGGETTPTPSLKTYTCSEGSLYYEGEGMPPECGGLDRGCAESSGQFASDEAAVAGLCGDHYGCISGMIFNYETRSQQGCNNCAGTVEGYFKSDAAALAALCDD